MKVFISWSGSRSGQVAMALAPWLKSVIQSTEPFLSKEMERGERWANRIRQELSSHSLGILCVTPDNTRSPWLNFEAGALSNQLEDAGSRVVPYLVGFQSPKDVEQPLSQFNIAMADREGTLELVQTLNKHAEYQQEDAALAEQFSLRWPTLEAALQEASDDGETAPPRSLDAKVDELLDVTRQLLRRNELPDYNAWYQWATARQGSTDAGELLVNQLLEQVGDKPYSAISAQDKLKGARVVAQVLSRALQKVNEQEHRAIAEQLLPDDVDPGASKSAPSEPTG